MMVGVYLCLRTEDMHASDSNLQSNKPECINCELRDNDAACMIGGSVDHYVRLIAETNNLRVNITRKNFRNEHIQE